MRRSSSGCTSICSVHSYSQLSAPHLVVGTCLRGPRKSWHLASLKFESLQLDKRHIHRSHRVGDKSVLPRKMIPQRSGEDSLQDQPLSHANVNGTSLAYYGIGKGDPLVLVHANLSDMRSWNSIANTFAEKFRVIVYSRRYAWPNEAIADGVADPWKTHADDLAALITNLKIAPAYVLGNSTGATIGLLLAREQPELLRSLFLEEPPLISLFLPKTPSSLFQVLRLAWFHPWSFLPVLHFGAAVIACIQERRGGSRIESVFERRCWG